MNPEAVLIIKPAVNVKAFLAITRQLEGKNLAEAFDKHNESVEGFNAFLSMLLSFDCPDRLDVLTFGFMVVCDCSTMTSMIVKSGIPVLWKEHPSNSFDYAIFSGTLTQWRTFLIQESSAFELRVIKNKIVLALESQGLGLLFFDRRKQDNGDGTFVLRET